MKIWLVDENLAWGESIYIVRAETADDAKRLAALSKGTTVEVGSYWGATELGTETREEVLYSYENDGGASCSGC